VGELVWLAVILTVSAPVSAAATSVPTGCASFNISSLEGGGLLGRSCHNASKGTSNKENAKLHVGLGDKLDKIE
jgi:hypothetical protein